MRRLAVTLAFAGARVEPAVAQDTSARAVDVVRSRASFSVSHLLVRRVEGTVPIVSGAVTFAAGSNVPTSIEATLDPKRIATDDADRDDDLQGPDWFDTKAFPTWTYRSETIAAAAGGGFTVSGTLTVHGKGEPVTLAVTPAADGPAGPSYHAVGHASRKGFGMRVTQFDAIVGDDIAIVLNVTLK